MKQLVTLVDPISFPLAHDRTEIRPGEFKGAAFQKGQDIIMIEVTAKAAQAVAEYCRDKEKLPIRIYLKIGGCGMRAFGLALETAEPSDELFEIGDYSYIIERQLLQLYGPIKVNSDGFSFLISGKGIHPPIGCGTCGYGCGSRGGHRCSGDCISCKTPCPTGQRLRSRRTHRQ